MNKTNVVILGTILCLTISGCSAKIEGGDPQASGVKPTPTPTPTSGQG